MLSQDQILAFKHRLEAQLSMLEGHADIRRSSTGTVELDQTRVGRLSRMDALQGQAMALATQARAEQQITHIRAALRRIERGEFGECVRCEDAIAYGRLHANPAAALCLACAEQAEQERH